MEKTILIDNKYVRLKATASFLKIYNAQTGKDFIPTVMPILDKLVNKDLSQSLHEVTGFELFDIFTVVWSLAKNADKEIAEPEIWLDSFENFPLDEILPTVFELLLGTFFSANFQKKTKDWIQDIPKKMDLLLQNLLQTLSQETYQYQTSKELQSDN